MANSKNRNKQLSLYEKDKAAFENFENGKSGMDINVFKRLMLHEVVSTSISKNEVRIGKYHPHDIIRILNNPYASVNELLSVNEQMMRVSSYYRRMVKYLGNLATFDWFVDVVSTRELTEADAKNVKSKYNALTYKLEKMHLKHEFSKIMNVIASQDVFYGVINESSSDFFIQKINPKYCTIYEIQDGIYNFAIDLTMLDPLDIDEYPSYIQTAYAQFLNDKSKGNMYVPDPDKQICIKFDESTVKPVPFLLPIVKDIFDLAIFKELKLQSARTDNYKAVMVDVPVDSSKPDASGISLEMIELFSELNREYLSDDIAYLVSYGKGQAVSFKNNSNTRNNVEDATNDLFNSAGINSNLFNGGTSSSTMTLSIENDAALIYRVYRQFERWLGRYIKYQKFNTSVFRFEVSILDSNVFNRKDVFDRYLKAAQSGAPTKRAMVAALGMTPNAANNGLLLENSILEWDTKWTPLKSSFTQSSEDEAGRPTSDVVDEGGEVSREREDR